MQMSVCSLPYLGILAAVLGLLIAATATPAMRSSRRTMPDHNRRAAKTHQSAGDVLPAGV
jgi:flagellar motor component MotA